ncbi:hypothetical protein Droror1_Dr00005702 [Drosera rotundifolia]
MVAEQKIENTISNIVLTRPFYSNVDSNEEYKTPNIIIRIFSLFKNIRPGSDITSFKMPPIFSLPKSHLQCYAESVCAMNQDVLGNCSEGKSPLERMIRVVAWSISTARPLLYGATPFNPVLGETHHVSRGTLNVLLEQVSHHPPVSALHATDESNKVELVWCQHYALKLRGTYIEAANYSKRRLYLWEKGESYVMNFPNLIIKMFPIPGCEYAGDVKIKCEESGLEAVISYKTNSLLSFGGNNRAIKGKIIESFSSKVLYEVSGHWDRTVTIKDTNNGKVKVIYDATEVVSGLRAPTLKNAEELSQTESAVIWAGVSRGILAKEWDKAGEAKKRIEEKERELVKRRNSSGETWVAKHFNVSYSEENGWDSSPKEKILRNFNPRCSGFFEAASGLRP